MVRLFRFTFRLSLLCSFLLAASFVAAEDPSAWNQWRGPARDGQVEAADWPKDLAEESLKLDWSAKLGPSYSGPIVSPDKVFTTETKDKRVEVVTAFDRKTGKQVWQTEWEGSIRVPFFAASNGSWIRATPALDGDRLYVAGIRDVVVCLDANSGEVQWRLDFVEETGSAKPAFGFVASPLVAGNHVYVQAGGSLAKLDKTNGKIIWQTLKDGGGMYGSAFSSPVMATIAGTPQLVVQTRTKLAGVDPEDGKVLWSQEIKAFRGMNILTPTVIGDAVFTSSYGGRSMLLKISKAGDTWSVDQAWEQKSQGYMSSPVVIDGHIYLHLRNQRFTCLDAATGEEQWTTKPYGKYWSLIANGNRLLALDQRGDLLLIDASPEEFKAVATREVADDSWAHLAIAGDEIFVRDLKELKKFTWK